MIGQIGITGGIGSGKSTVASIFQSLGYLIYDADKRAKLVANENKVVVKEIKAAFGENAYQNDGELDRKKMAGIVFKSPEKLQKLNSIIHPAIFEDYNSWYSNIPTTYTHPFILKEAAILFESGSWKQSDAVITVYAPQELRIERVLHRDDTSREDIIKRMENQWPDKRKIDLADFTIYNDGIHPVIPQVLQAIQYFKDKFSGQA